MKKLSEDRIDTIMADFDIQAMFSGPTAPLYECVHKIADKVQEEVVRLQGGLPVVELDNQSSRTRAFQAAMQRKREADHMLFLIALAECAEEAHRGGSTTNCLMRRLRSALPDAPLQVGDYDPNLDRELADMDVPQPGSIE